MDPEVWLMLRSTFLGLATLGVLYVFKLESGSKTFHFMKQDLFICLLVAGGMYFYGSFDKHKA
jgi:hypothetical protein